MIDMIINIKVKDYGTMRLKLYEDKAPITVKNFEKLVEQKFYDNLIFHRIIKDFMIQGGDPEGTGMGGSKENIKGEFLMNGVKNPISHKRGTISMARAQNPNSASSQFFICHRDCKFLDGNYAAFGDMIDGFEVLDKIASVATDHNDRPLQDVTIESIRIEK